MEKHLQTYLKPQCDMLRLEQQGSCCITPASVATSEAISPLEGEDYDFGFVEE